MNTIFKNIPAFLRLPSESSNAAKTQKRIVHLKVTIKPGELKDTMLVHFEVPPRYIGAFDSIVFRLQNSTIEWPQITPEKWVDTKVGSIDTSHVFLCVKYL